MQEWKAMDSGEKKNAGKHEGKGNFLGKHSDKLGKAACVIGAAVMLLAIVCAFAFIFLAGSKADPAKNMWEYTMACVHQDKEMADKVKIPYEEMHRQMVSACAEEFCQKSGNAVNMEQARAVTESCFAQWKKLEVHTKTISKNGKTAVVEITLGKLSPLDTNMLREKLQAIPKDTTHAKRGDIIVDIYKEAYEARQQMGLISFEIECQYDSKKKVWVPKDVQNYANQIKAAIDDSEGRCLSED